MVGFHIVVMARWLTLAKGKAMVVLEKGGRVRRKQEDSVLHANLQKSQIMVVLHTCTVR